MSLAPQSIAYKESGIPWVGKIPEHWEIRKIKQVARIVTGKTPSEESNQDWGNDLMFITPTDCLVGKKYVSSSARKLSQEGIKNFASIIVPKDSILVSCIASIGKVAVNSENALTNQQINTVIPNKNLSSTDFLYYQLLIAMPFVEKYFCGYSTLPIINKGDFSNVPIVLPPLKEQQAIADFLDKKTRQIEEFIDKKQKLITLLEEKKQVLINQCVTQGLDSSTSLKDSGVEWLGKIPTHWEVKKLKLLFGIGSGLGITKADFLPSGIPCVSYGEIHSKYPCRLDTRIHSLPYVSEDYLENKPQALLKKGDFVFADTSEDIEGSGNFTSLQSDEPVFAGYHTIVLKPKTQSIHSPYFSFLFDSLGIRNQVRKEVCGVKVYSITKSILKEVQCLIPPLEEQKVIAEYLDTQIEKIDLAICKIKTQINLIKEYKTTLISEAVCGRVGID